MPKITVDTYEIIVKMVIRKDYWKEQNKEMTEKDLEDKIQEGIETPIESFETKIIR